MSFAATEFRKQSASAFGKGIQHSKLDVNSVKKTAADIQKFAKFVSDGLQMVHEDSQKNKAAVTIEEARQQKKERERKKILGFEIGPSEEELASQLMEGGKHLAIEGGKNFAKFASDGLQMVYHAAEKQTKEYIASKSASDVGSRSTGEKTKDATMISATSTPFFAASGDTTVTKKAEKVEPKPSTIDEQASPKPFYAATSDGKETQAKRVKNESTVADRGSKNPFFAATHTDRIENKPVQDVTIKNIVHSPPTNDGSKIATDPLATNVQFEEDPKLPATTSSLLRSGGRMLAKFVGDGLQMVQRVATSKEKRYRRPPK